MGDKAKFLKKLHWQLGVVLLITFSVLSTAPKLQASSDLERAKNYLEQGDARSAIIELKNALQEDPDHAEARFLLGSAYLKLGDNAAAESQLQKAKTLGFGGEELELMLAYARLGQGRLEEIASDASDTGIPETDIQKDLFVARAEALLGLGRIEEAEAVLDTVLETGQHARALAAKSQIAQLTEDQDAARGYLGQALDLEPNDPRLLTLDAQWLFRERRFEDARDRFAQAIERAPTLLAAYLGKVQAHLALNELSEAGEIIEELKSSHPDSLAIVLQDSILQLVRGNFKGAKTAADRVLAAAPDNPRALFVSGASAYRLKRFEQARAHLSAYLAHQPLNHQARALLGATMLRLGYPEEAYDTVRDIEETQVDNLSYLGVLTAAAFQSGDQAAGAKYLEKLAAKAPENAEVQERLGMARLSVGDVDGGSKALEAAIAAEPERLSAYTRLFAIRLQQEDLEEAIEIARTIENQFPGSSTGPTLMGIANLTGGRRSDARRAFQRAVTREPGNAEAAGNLASILWIEGEVDEAREILESVLDVNPGDLQTLMRYARLEQRAGKGAKAEVLLEHAIEDHPEDSQPRVLLAQLFLQSGKPAEALELVNHLIIDKPQDVGVLEVVGLARSQTGDSAGALETFSILVELTPQSAQAHAYLMSALERRGKIAEALEAADRALVFDSSLASARFGRVRYLTQLGRTQEAKAGLEALKADHTDAAEIYIVESRIALVEKRPSDALASIEYAHKLRGDSRSLLELARIKVALGNRNAALADMQTWLVDNPNDVVIRNALARFSITLGQLQNAKTHYKTLLETAPNNVQYLNNLAWVETELGETQKAVSLAKRAYELAPANADVADTLAMALLGTGDQKEALRLLEGAVRASPENPIIRFHFAQVLSESGDREAATSELKTLLGTKDNFPDRDKAQELLQALTQNR